MNSLPILLKNPKVLLIGGGKVGLQKATVLFQNGVNFKVISKEYIKEFNSLNIQMQVKEFDIKDTEDLNFVINATGSQDITKKLLLHKNFLLNVVDKPEYCDFFFSSILNHGRLKIAISSDGVSPTITQAVRDEIKKIIPQDIENITLKQVANRAMKKIEKIKTEVKNSFTQLYLIGCGLGDAELLTIKAYKTMQIVDIVLYDHLVTEEILELLPLHVERVFVGKKKGFHSKNQEDINTLMLYYLNKGLKVARLKSGDPYIFGRGAEEAIDIIQKGYKVEVINGLSSSIAGVAEAGIPVTARGYATNFSIVSAHLKDSKINLDWIDLLNIKNHTTVVLMGLSLCKEIRNMALSKKINKHLEVAIISNASRNNQKVKITTLENLYYDSLEMQSPAILVFGKVVNLHKLLS